jgi:hypothetical protein
MNKSLRGRIPGVGSAAPEFVAVKQHALIARPVGTTIEGTFQEIHGVARTRNADSHLVLSSLSRDTSANSRDSPCHGGIPNV